MRGLGETNPEKKLKREVNNCSYVNVVLAYTDDQNMKPVLVYAVLNNQLGILHRCADGRVIHEMLYCSGRKNS